MFGAQSETWSNIPWPCRFGGLYSYILYADGCQSYLTLDSYLYIRCVLLEVTILFCRWEDEFVKVPQLPIKKPWRYIVSSPVVGRVGGPSGATELLALALPLHVVLLVLLSPTPLILALSLLGWDGFRES